MDDLVTIIYDSALLNFSLCIQLVIIKKLLTFRRGDYLDYKKYRPHRSLDLAIITISVFKEVYKVPYFSGRCLCSIV